MTQASTYENVYKTAMFRKKPSVPGRYVVETLLPQLEFKSILDWGCGRGRDVLYFKEQGLICEGYDPHYSPDIPAGTFDFVMCSYVLNVIAAGSKRKQCLNELSLKLEPDGHVLIAIRPAKEVVRNAFNFDYRKGRAMAGDYAAFHRRSVARRKTRWNICADGYVTTRGTFQSLLTMPALLRLIEEAGFEAIHEINNSKMVMVLAQKA